MSDFPATTPPAHVRVLTLEAVEAEQRKLRQHHAEAYAELRRVSDRLEELAKRSDEHHLVLVGQIGSLARMLRER